MEPLSPDIESALGAHLVDRINDIVAEFCKDQRGILIDGEPDAAIMLAGAVYGDPDEVMARCLKRGIPVMIENPGVLLQ